MSIRRRAYAAILAVLLISILGCDLSTPTATQPPTTLGNPTVTPTTAGGNSGSALPAWLKVYFTDPNPPDNLGHGIDQYVVPVLNAAQQTIDLASFDLNLPSVITALVSASQRGVKVRVVYDGTNGNLDLNNDATNNKALDAIKTLKAGKVSLVDGGRSSGLMHDKMIIVDGQTLFMGSWNMSYNDTYRNNNNLLEISEPRLIANYQAKFNELFVDKHFGAKARVEAPNPNLTADGVQVENYFAPEDNVMDKLVSYVQGATKSVHTMIYTYTHADLAAAMIASARKGVEVQTVIENRAASQGALPDLFCAGLAVKTDGNPYTMHDKVIIIDGQIVITGSFNFTKSADTVNDDNVLVIHSAAVAALYEAEFQYIYGMGDTPQAADITCK